MSKIEVKPGPVSLLERPGTFAEIKKMVLQGKTLKEIAIKLGVSQSSVYQWNYKNLQGFNDKYREWQRMHLLGLATGNLKEFLEMDVEEHVIGPIGMVKDKEGKEIKKQNSNLMRIKADMTKFVLERLDKENYALRSEVTGANGEPLLGALHDKAVDKRKVIDAVVVSESKNDVQNEPETIPDVTQEVNDRLK